MKDLSLIKLEYVILLNLMNVIGEIMYVFWWILCFCGFFLILFENVYMFIEFLNFNLCVF